MFDDFIILDCQEYDPLTNLKIEYEARIRPSAIDAIWQQKGGTVVATRNGTFYVADNIDVVMDQIETQC